MANEPIPVYVFTGFLESGKTKFIQDILADPNFTCKCKFKDTSC